MKNELKIAIAICSKLRDSLDKEMRPHSISKEDMEIQVNKSMDYYKTLSPPGFDEEIPKKIFDKFKEIVLQARTEIHKSQKKFMIKFCLK